MLYIAWMVILGGHNSKKKLLKTSIFELPRLKNCISRLWTGAFTSPLLVETAISRLWQGISAALGKATECKKRSSVS